MKHITCPPCHNADLNSPIIIIAAARSGTKMLRATLDASPEFACFPYDINYIWKYGNYNIPHDELTVDDLTDDIRNFIRKQFQKLQAKSSAEKVLEKSVPNSLRIDFVKAVFPECKIIHLFRDGRDVAVSAKACWQSSLFSNRIQKKSDLFKKLADFPLAAAWPYLLTYASTYGRRLISKEEYVESWGPRFQGIDEAVKNYSLLEVCAIQWAESISVSLKHLSALEEYKDYINIRYENLVSNPVKELEKIADFVHIKKFQQIKEYAEKNISRQYIAKWKKILSPEEIELTSSHIHSGLERLSYL